MKKILNLILAFGFGLMLVACDEEEPALLEESIIVFQSSSVSIQESGTTYSIKILGSEIGNSSTVTIEGTAVEGEDYTTTFTNPATVGDDYAFYIDITPIDNAISDGNKTLTFTLNEGGYSDNTDEGKVFTLTIIDDDCPYVSTNFEGAAATDDLIGGESNGTYDTSVELVSDENGVALFNVPDYVASFLDVGYPYEFSIDSSDPSNIKVNVETQEFSAYGFDWVITEIAGGEVSTCGNTVTVATNLRSTDNSYNIDWNVVYTISAE
ncbi:hypothetical protein [Fulvivirga ligni]|uniref:hypothetical protein n=1 Tax=Fulvivirga ligni TaxID=2904246 RepID=UPI001F47492E|nr:hypothetical protein [Fulvivirga ligni]UII23489.1 hypothetical protein LVD16_09640 [Fulvivirga ligni]